MTKFIKIQEYLINIENITCMRNENDNEYFYIYIQNEKEPLEFDFDGSKCDSCESKTHCTHVKDKAFKKIMESMPNKFVNVFGNYIDPKYLSYVELEMEHIVFKGVEHDDFQITYEDDQMNIKPFCVV